MVILPDEIMIVCGCSLSSLLAYAIHHLLHNPDSPHLTSNFLLSAGFVLSRPALAILNSCFPKSGSFPSHAIRFAPQNTTNLEQLLYYFVRR